MRKILLLCILIPLFNACNDGDLIVYEVNFDDVETVQDCGNLVLYKVKQSPFESLSIQLVTSFQDIIDEFDPDSSENITTFTINNTTNTFIYRTYAEDYSAALADELFCNDVPTASVTISSSNESDTGTVRVYITLEEDDNDGIPAEFEDENTDGDNDPGTNPTDTDGDGIPNYLDTDDDNDNVPTVQEAANFSDENGLADALDTDADGTPDYLDNDDDNDGIPTREEERLSQDNNPLNDISDIAVGPDFKNPDVAESFPPTTLNDHTIAQEYTFTVTVEGFTLAPLIYADPYAFGSLIKNESRLVSVPLDD